MNYGEAKARVREAIGEPTDLDTQIQRWLHDAISETHSEQRWLWDQGRVTVLARELRTGLTGSWTNGATSVTSVTSQPVQAIADLYVGGLIRLAGVSVHQVVSWTVSTSTIVVTPAIIEATAVAAALEITGHDVISLPSTVMSVLEVVDHRDSFRFLNYKPDYQFAYPNPFELVGGIPFNWSTNGVDSLGNVRLAILPPPSEDRLYTLKVHFRPRYPSSDSDELEAITGIPQNFHKGAIVARAIYEAKKNDFERPDMMPEIMEYKDTIHRMKKYSRSDAGKIWKHQKISVGQVTGIEQVTRQDRVDGV